MNNKVRVIVMMGGPSSEHDVSMASGAEVFRALEATGRFQVEAVTISREGRWALAHEAPKVLPKPGEASDRPMPREEAIQGIQLLHDAEVVFLAFHGPFGEDGTLQGLLQSLSVPYTGSGPLASALAMNKAKAKELFRYHGLMTPRDLPLSSESIKASLENAVQAVEANVPYPVVVKPNLGGSSLGVSVAENHEELAAALAWASRFDADVLVEEKVSGRELTCAVLEELDGGVRALPVIEIVPKKGTFFDFASKYEDGGSDEICPADLTEDQSRVVQDVAIRAHQALGCRGFSRTDLFLTSTGPIVLEVNTIPGMTPNSLLPKAARAAGISFPDLMAHLVDVAIKRGV
ncbi:D-alanine--D-alanine ligase family protein [Sulfobacillus harzensis]|uniref:D-alanine--D-alanine ligase n=1 Tax=Sulfobacillus harzensis TaxID=2729629 RepID=A0A7Y0Q3U7_9FIRM|nr:D-alanine--D-alanine ligase [Sulfobacillus harzensis]NMP23750.1 D-alanine--D-alanine ligase [Sulfobacillus harzensis]